MVQAGNAAEGAWGRGTWVTPRGFVRLSHSSCDGNVSRPSSASAKAKSATVEKISVAIATHSPSAKNQSPPAPPPRPHLPGAFCVGSKTPHSREKKRVRNTSDQFGMLLSITSLFGSEGELFRSLTTGSRLLLFFGLSCTAAKRLRCCCVRWRLKGSPASLHSFLEEQAWNRLLNDACPSHA